ncbi:fetuin-B isoform X2 [Pteropus alecto]|uniref:fetuin-B isoform X2 n=1 Tax=Pteropus alecto TaxID=9402 RepID=UPI0007686C1E|nr:fetuin-B isoform X2 [Pteropus alecto]
MGLLLPLVLCSLATFYTVESLPQEALSLLPLLSRGCNDSDVLAVAGFALQDVNSNRKDGYVLSLNRVSDVREHRQVYGQCKAIFYINKPRRVLYLPAYNCILRPVSRRKIHRMCPDCPSPDDLSNPRVLEAATESLAKYNNENTLKQYALFKVTKASSQWVFGPATFVEYLIKESPCTKSEASSCALQLTDSVPVGLCKGSLSQSYSEKFVSVTCDFFESQAPTPGEENSADNQGPANLPKAEEPQQINTAPTDSPSKAMPKGSVQYLLDLDDEKPEGSQEKGPVEAFPVQLDLTTNPQGETLDVSFLFLGPMKEKLVVLPFPKEEKRSAKCPGPAQRDDPLVLPP